MSVIAKLNAIGFGGKDGIVRAIFAYCAGGENLNLLPEDWL
jgi:hypothetical protein